jgi:hypothetical protein
VVGELFVIIELISLWKMFLDMYNTVPTTAKTTTAATNPLTAPDLFGRAFLLACLETAAWVLVTGRGVDEVWDISFFGWSLSFSWDLGEGCTTTVTISSLVLNVPWVSPRKVKG